jgi:RNA polymerase sigma-70 factor (ECF subfamily)
MEMVLLSLEFEANRPRLRPLAYRILGSYEEADDAVQDTWLRVVRADVAEVGNFGGWFTTVTARICLDRLRARRARPETPTGLQADTPHRLGGGANPEHEVLVAASLESALVVVLDRLAPVERVAFVLHDVFAVPFDAIAQIVDRNPAATRQLASRARRRVQGASPTGDSDVLVSPRIVEAFFAAARKGDFDGLLAVLDPDVVLRPDADALRMGAAAEARGAHAVGRQMSGGAQAARLALVGDGDGDGVGLAFAPEGHIRGAIAFVIAGGRIVGISLIGNAGYLQQLDVTLLDD